VRTSIDAMSARMGVVVVLSMAGVSACASTPPLTSLVETRRLVAEVQAAFASAAEASNRAIMADSDGLSTAAADEARRARQTIAERTATLEGHVRALGDPDDLQHLQQFQASFVEYARLDYEILGLAVENTNAKAQRLSFGAARETADEFNAALDDAIKRAARVDPWRTEAVAATARLNVLRILVLQAPHIAEADAAAMTAMEQEMAAAAQGARVAFEELRSTMGNAGPQLETAATALDRFEAINKEILTLSRRNSEVESLALSLGRKRVVAAAGQDRLRALQQALEQHAFNATR
jgi:hypothetical protein